MPNSELQSPVREGDLVAGKYRVERVLGVGGMGVVVRARHVELGQEVALKFLLNEIAFKAEHAARFLREARAAAALKSDHVARVLDLGKLETGQPFLVMELLEGRDLGELLLSSKLVDARTYVRALGGILDELLTGRLPFDGEGVARILSAIAADAPVPLRVHLPGAPLELEAAILKCLAKDRAHRFANVG